MYAKTLRSQKSIDMEANPNTRAIYMKFVSDLRCLKHTNRVYANVIEDLRSNALSVNAKDFKDNGPSSK